MLRVYSDWNNLKSDGTLRVLIPYEERVPKIGEAILACDSGERVAALVIEHNKYTDHGVLITVEPNWDSQEPDINIHGAS